MRTVVNQATTSVPLEDELGDVIDKAMHRAGLTDESLAQLSGVPAGRILDAIDYRSDLSPESVDYIHRLVKHVSQPGQPCRNCRLYRAEKPGILQGILRHPNVAPSTTLGSCPSGFDTVKNDCPKWDANCQCHGPVMTKGMVAWAAGKSGPDFFIDNYPSPAKWWGTQHTGMYECAFLFLVGESFSTVLLCVLIFVL